jgi:hypothetical protein
VLARVEYRAGKNAKSGPLTYNTQSLVVGSWQQNVSQLFEVTVDLNAHTTSLSINGVVVAQGQSYVNSAAANLAHIAVVLNHNDIQTLGWDDISITRQADQP